MPSVRTSSPPASGTFGDAPGPTPSGDFGLGPWPFWALAQARNFRKSRKFFAQNSPSIQFAVYFAFARVLTWRPAHVWSGSREINCRINLVYSALILCVPCPRVQPVTSPFRIGPYAVHDEQLVNTLSAVLNFLGMCICPAFRQVSLEISLKFRTWPL
jgi:hypothetical protein